MRTFINPSVTQWPSLIARPCLPAEDLDATVSAILKEVRLRGDAGIRDLALKYDKVSPAALAVTPQEMEQAGSLVPEDLKAAIAIAANNIRRFHQSQVLPEEAVTTMEGVSCWRRSVAIESVGLYIPGGSAPLFSTVLMLAIPAQIAGCDRIALCTPSDKNGDINPVVLYTASFLGIREIYKAGGAQAIAALAYGTESIPRVDKIFGPGNQYVTKAKALVQQDGVAIDLPAGPSEVLVITDRYADADFVAADLLSQAEHGTDSQVVLLSDDENFSAKVLIALEAQLKALPRAAIAVRALENSLSLTFPNIHTCIAFSNAYAPEHLILAIDTPEQYIDNIRNAGSVFLGNYSCESAGDYASGTNHTLPTNGYARSYSGVSVDSFLKKITFQEITKQGLVRIGNVIEVMAEAEQLAAHKNAVTIRLKKIYNEQ